jgi:hypothetical protein
VTWDVKIELRQERSLREVYVDAQVRKYGLYFGLDLPSEELGLRTQVGDRPKFRFTKVIWAKQLAHARFMRSPIPSPLAHIQNTYQFAFAIIINGGQFCRIQGILAAFQTNKTGKLEKKKRRKKE